MLKTLLAVVMGLVSLTAHASQLVRLDVDQKANSYAVYVVMELDAPAEKVRAILTDYAHLDRLNASIIASKIMDDKGDGTVRVLTRFENCIVFFCMTVQRVEDITEDGQGRILVTLVPDASSFRSGQASWEVTSTGSGSRVIHRATLEPDFWPPPWIGTALPEGDDAPRDQGKFREPRMPDADGYPAVCHDPDGSGGGKPAEYGSLGRCWGAGKFSQRNRRNLMNTYIIRRHNAWKNTQELEATAARSLRIGNDEMADQIRWIRSYVVQEADGTLGTVCVYQATNADAIRDHARRWECQPMKSRALKTL